jgi:hypothetical protein
MTNNREYHLRENTCIAVRDRATGVWISNHEAVGMTHEVPLPARVFRGLSLSLTSAVARLKTSKVVRLARPDKETVRSYNFVWGFAAR